jgi:hypothetical protein
VGQGLIVEQVDASGFREQLYRAMECGTTDLESFSRCNCMENGGSPRFPVAV